MATLLIQARPKDGLLTLQVITSKDKIHPLIEKKNWKSTLISEKKTCYLYLNKESDDYNFTNLYNHFVNFSGSNERNWNIDIQSFVSQSLTEELVIQAVSEGILFGTHKSIKFKKEENKKKDNSYYLITKSKKAPALLDNSLSKLEAVNWARDLQDSPPNKLHAQEFAEIIQKQFSKFKNIIELEILNRKNIEKNKMGLLLAVNAGSHHEPRVVILRYFGDKKNKKNVLGLVGKGITFDSGGYDLKPSSALQCMKFDMSGAAVVCASFLTLVQKKPKINVVAVACLTENAIGGHATLTESVITSMSGKTVEINNTDAEGRLVLADGITYAVQKEKASKIITVATLTGACVLALGENTTGIMTNNSSFYQQFSQAATKAQERIWELPLFPEH